MKDLMVHVEKIVRPIGAMQFRKLRMRRELLAHLRAAVDEERAAGVDEASAVARAKSRLGDPKALTTGLQESVPWIERVLMMRVPAVSVIDHLEKYSEPVWGLDRGATLLHSGIVMLGGMVLGYLALMFAVLVITPREMLAGFVDHPVAAAWMYPLNLLSVCILMIASSGLMFAITRGRRPRWHYLRMMVVAAMPTIAMTLTVAATARRAPMPHELLRSVATGAALLLSLFSLAQIVARMRRPYDPWLTLDLAE